MRQTTILLPSLFGLAAAGSAVGLSAFPGSASAPSVVPSAVPSSGDARPPSAMPVGSGSPSTLALEAERVPPEIAVEGPPVFPLKNVKRGLRGYGYTVFSSARGPERFEFEVLGVMRGYLGPGEDLIIAQLHGEQIERTGVIAGMSGSPVYVDGKLVGAVGYRFGSFTKDPIAGITPIERMLTAAPPPSATASAGTSPEGMSPAGMSAAGVSAAGMSRAGRSPATGPARRGAQTAWGEAEPIAVPIAVSGIHRSVLDGFAEELDRRGYGPRVAAGAKGVESGPARRFFAGGPIAGTLVDGDINMAGIGTVTWVKGDRFLAFGHPFNGTGRSTMPVSNAEILTTVAADSSSWKLGQATAPVGFLTDDRLHAIAGTMGGAPPATVDVEVALDLAGPREESDALDVVKVRIVRDGAESALFAAITVANTLTNRIGLERGGTVDLEAEVTLSTGHVVTVRDRASLKSSAGVFVQVAIGLLGELMGLVQNGFVEVELDRIRVKVRHREDVLASQVAAVDATSALVAGRRAEVRVRLFYEDEGLREERVPVSLPVALAEGHWRLMAASPDQTVRLLREGGMLGEPLSFEGVLEERGLVPPPGRVSLFLVRDAQGLKLGGRGMPALPDSLHGLLEGGGGLSGTLVETQVVPIGTLDVPGIVAGQSGAKVWVDAYAPPDGEVQR